MNKVGKEIRVMGCLVLVYGSALLADDVGHLSAKNHISFCRPWKRTMKS